MARFALKELQGTHKAYIRLSSSSSSSSSSSDLPPLTPDFDWKCPTHTDETNKVQVIRSLHGYSLRIHACV
jgi:hypothetical protein